MEEAKQNQPGDNWAAYYQAIEGRQPRPLFIAALARFAGSPATQSPRNAIDLGCGDGTETLVLLQHGWKVLAIDREPAAIASVQSRARKEHLAQLEIKISAFEGLELPGADFVYAGLSLPFCQPASFAPLWSGITASVRPGGRFAGHLFGEHDSWAGNPEMTFHALPQVKHLLAGSFEIELLQEEERDGEAFSGPKHWHVFHLIARKAASRL